MFMGAIALLTGCIPTMVECRYFHLNAQPGLVVLAKSSSYGECRCRGAQAATEYRLSRTNYVIDFAMGIAGIHN